MTEGKLWDARRYDAHTQVVKHIHVRLRDYVSWRVWNPIREPVWGQMYFSILNQEEENEAR